MNTNSKAWYKSKTIWFNVISAILMVVAQLIPDMKGFMTPETYMIVSSVVNILLRTITNEGIKAKG